MTAQELVDASQKAIAYMNACDFEKAARCWESILKVQPNWEHGVGAYNLAVCYEEIERFEDADRLYREALCRTPDDEVFMGGYGSFLYLHGAANDAFDVFIQLFRKALIRQDAERQESIATALIELGARLGLSESQVHERLAQLPTGP